MSLLSKVKGIFNQTTSDDEGWIRQGKFTPAKNLKDWGNQINQRWQAGGGAQQLNPIRDLSNNIRNNPAMAQVQRVMTNPQTPQKVGDWLRTNANQQADYAESKNAPGYIPKMVRFMGDFGGNFAQTMTSAATRGGTGLARTVAPDSTFGERLQGAAQTGFAIAKAGAAGTPLFNYANLASSLPRKDFEDKDVFRRFAGGIISGQTNEPLATNVPERKTNLGFLGEHDLVRGAGSMYGFTQNPAWKKIFGKTSAIQEAKWLKNPVTNFLATRGVKGGIEGLLQGLGEMPDGLTDKEKAKFVTENILTGIGSEVIFDALGKGVEVSGKRLWNGPAQEKALAQTFDYVRDAWGRFAKQADKIKYPTLKPEEIKFIKTVEGNLKRQGLDTVKFGQQNDLKQVAPKDAMGTTFKAETKLNPPLSDDLRKYDFLIKKANDAKLKRQSGKIDLGAEVGEPKGLGGEGVTTAGKTSQLPQQTGLQTKTSGVLQTDQPATTQTQKLSPSQKQYIKIKQSSDQIISKATEEIGSVRDEPKVPLKQKADNFYTQFVDRYFPVVKASGEAKKALKTQGAELRPEYDPEYLVRRLSGAGGIADYRYKTELKPIIDSVDSLGIPKAEMDAYLKARRDIGLSARDIIGSDAKVATDRIQAFESKYGQGIKDIADKFYQYQNKGFQELIDSGFLSKETGELIRKQNPDYVPFERAMDEIDNYLGVPSSKLMQGSQPVKKIKGSTKKVLSPIESIIANTFRQRAAIEKNRVAKSIAGLQDVTDMGFKQVSKAGEDTITVWNNGKKEYWNVGKDIAEVAKATNEEAMNLILKILQAPAKLLRTGATGRNPDFMAPNVVRDQLDAGISSKYGYIPFIDYARGLKSLITKDDIYQKWANSGANIDLGEMSGRKSIKQSFDQKTAKKNLFTWLGKGLDVMGEVSEQPTRIGLFKKAYEKTGNEMLAMMESREGTLDFSRMGNKMKVANSIIPFLNVGVQGFDKLIRTTMNSPGKTALKMGVYAVLPQAMATVYNMISHPEEYNEIPQYEKDDNFVLIRGRNEDGTVDYMTIPKGNIVPVVSNPVQHFIEFLAQTDQQSFKEMALNLISSTLPIIGEGSSVKEIATKTIGQNLPQMIKPATENLLNRSFWKYDQNKEESKEIVPYYLKNKEPYQQTYKFTPAMYQGIGKVINASPLQVQNFMEGYLAGFSKIPSQIVTMLDKVSKGEEISPNDKTIMRRFFKQTYPSSSKVKIKSETPKTGFFARIFGNVEATGEKELPTNTEDLKVLYKDALSSTQNYSKNKVKAQYGLVEKDLEEYQDEFDQSNALLKRIEKERPEQVFDIQLDTYKSGGGATVKERVAWAKDKLSNASDTEKAKIIEKMLSANVLTKSVVEGLREAGVSVNKYTEGGKVKTYGGKSKKGKTISVKKATVPKIQIAKSKSKIPSTVKIASPPKITLSSRKRKSLLTSSPYKAPALKIAPLAKMRVAKGGFLT